MDLGYMDESDQLSEILRFYNSLGVTHLNLEMPSASSLEAGIRGCKQCPRSRTRLGFITGWGSESASLMFLVDAPSESDLRAEEPLSGEVRELLHKIIRAIDLQPEEVYIANSVKCSVPGDRRTTREEIDACRSWVMRQVELVNPQIIVALGNTAVHSILATEENISSLRGRFHPLGAFLVMPTFHPEYLLHNPGAKSMVWHDMKMVRDRLKRG